MSSVTRHSFGQPVGAIIQVAYVVEHLERAMNEFIARLGAGPWFVWGPFTPPEGRYRGAPTDISLSLAVGFAGHLTIELIEQHDRKPSVYREVIERRGHGFHHWAVASESFDATVASHLQRGGELAFSDRTPRGYRVAYIDMGPAMPGMLEIIERTPAFDERYDAIYRASLGWDGQDPIRRG
jgi:hypothetical protein